MSTATPRSALNLDSAEIESLLMATNRGGEAIFATVRSRLRYLQRNNFPSDRTGRGKRATYDLADITRLLLAFELLDLDLTPQRATDTVRHSWGPLASAIVPAWRALRLRSGHRSPLDPAMDAELDALRRMAIITPDALSDDAGGFVVGLLRPSAVAAMVTGVDGGLRHAIVLDLFGIVRAMDAAMQDTAFGFTQLEIDAAFERFGEETFGTPSRDEWLPRSDGQSRPAG